jgi:hypothetical protein
MSSEKNITNRDRRPAKRTTRRTLKRLVEIVGVDGAHVALDAIEAGKDAKACMHALRPFIDRYVEACGEVKDTRKNFYKRLEA